MRAIRHAADHEIRLAIDQEGESLTDDRMVIHQEHPGLSRVWLRLWLVLTSDPPIINPGRGSGKTHDHRRSAGRDFVTLPRDPPTISARYFMMLSPMPGWSVGTPENRNPSSWIDQYSLRSRSRSTTITTFLGLPMFDGVERGLLSDVVQVRGDVHVIDQNRFVALKMATDLKEVLQLTRALLQRGHQSMSFGDHRQKASGQFLGFSNRVVHQPHDLRRVGRFRNRLFGKLLVPGPCS